MCVCCRSCDRSIEIVRNSRVWVCVLVWAKRTKRKKRKETKRKKGRIRKCVGGEISRKITRNWNGTYGVWLCGMVPISIDIVNDPKACVFALFASCMQYSAALHCTALLVKSLSIQKHATTPYVLLFCRCLPSFARCCCAVDKTVYVLVTLFVCTWYRFFYRICNFRRKVAMKLR